MATNWSTSSYGDSTDTSPMELSSLGEHLSLCQRLSGRLFGLRCGAELMHRFVAARLVTSLVLMALLITIGALLY